MTKFPFTPAWPEGAKKNKFVIRQNLFFSRFFVHCEPQDFSSMMYYDTNEGMTPASIYSFHPSLRTCMHASQWFWWCCTHLAHCWLMETMKNVIINSHHLEGKKTNKRYFWKKVVYSVSQCVCFHFVIYSTVETGRRKHGMYTNCKRPPATTTTKRQEEVFIFSYKLRPFLFFFVFL